MFRPNAPKMTTVLLAIGLFAVGLIGILPQLDQYIAPVDDLLASIPIFVELGLTSTANSLTGSWSRGRRC